MDLFSQGRDDWADALFADAQALAFDSEGRITLSQEMCQHSEITDTVAFVGRGPTFQMWNPEKFKVHQEAARQRLKEKKQGLVVA
jgi:MraZ protein